MGSQVVKDFILQLLQTRLKNTGVDANGEPLITDRAAVGEVYSYMTIQIKASKGQKFRNVTLEDTGEFYDSQDVELKDDEFEITGDFLKGGEHIGDNFLDSYPSNKDFEKAIAALDDAEFDILLDRIKPFIVQAARNELIV